MSRILCIIRDILSTRQVDPVVHQAHAGFVLPGNQTVGTFPIDRDLIVSAQREALQTLRCIISNLEYRFYKAYGMEIEDKRTVYGECTYRLVPREDEHSVCLMHDWIYLPSA